MAGFPDFVRAVQVALQGSGALFGNEPQATTSPGT
jgi:hypothetical protein